VVFSSIVFLFYFLPAFLVVYFFSPKFLKNYIALAASIGFYAWGAPIFVFVILASTIIDFYLVRMLAKAVENKIRKRYLFTSLFLNLGLLAYFKYANFFVDNVNAFLNSIGVEQVAWTSIALPIGISFYTFQTLTYSIDVYRRLHEPLHKLSDYLLYIMAFPQMIAGPIVRFTAVADQLESRQDTLDDKLIGFYRFCIGLAKKVLIANVMAEQADLIFESDLHSIPTSLAWVGMLAYTFQIYFDFAGYSDMAIGLGRMMGFRFPENFNSPYIARSISDFWRRWHMTLSGFMRDYLYIPLGGNKVGSNGRLYFNLILVFLLSGLWHGASWNYVLWGAYHGLFLMLDRLFLKKFLDRIGTAFSILFTFVVVMFGWVIFRLEDFGKMKLYLFKLCSFESGTIDFFDKIVPSFWFFLVLAIIFSFLLVFHLGERLQTFFFEKDGYSDFNHVALMVMSLILLFLSASSITSSGFNPFIYFRF
jgi:alginate O-acetyltransferase complex protein AlgI